MKLIRDNIPGIMKEIGKQPKTHAANEKEFEEALIGKLDEELKEIKEGRNVEEIADLIEVAYTLAKEYGATEDKVNILRKQKNLKNGAFEKKIILE